jgi:hypothetical protein
MKFNFRKITSVLASAVMLGSTAGFASAANYPAPFVKSGNADVALVVGQSAANSDFFAALKLTESLQAELATQTATPGSSSGAGVSGEGINLATSARKIYYGDSINAGRQVISSSAMPTILADGSFTDLTGTAYTYTQSIKPGDTVSVFGTSGGDLNDPILYLDVGTTTTDPLYNYTLSLNKNLNVSDNTYVQGQTIKIQGIDYVIGASSTNSTLYLFGAGQTVSIAGGESATVTVAGTEHVVELISTSSSTAAKISIDGQSRDVTKGGKYAFPGDLVVYVKSVTHPAFAGDIRDIELVMGANTLRLDNGAVVKSGADETSVKGTLATITAADVGKISGLTIQVALTKTALDHLAAGDSVVDPVFGGIKVEFAGAAPDLNDSSRKVIKIRTDNNQYAYATFVPEGQGDAAADADVETEFAYVYDSNTASTVVTPVLAHQSTASNRGYIHVREGANATVGDWIVINAGDAPHILEADNIDITTATAGKVYFTDKINGQAYTIDVTNSSGTYTKTTDIGGNSYTIRADQNGATVNVTWSTAGTATIFPRIKLKDGGWVAFLTQTTIPNATTVILPDGTTTLSTSGTQLVSMPNSNEVSVNGINWTYKNDTTGKVIINGISNPACNFNATIGPALLFIEPKKWDDSTYGNFVCMPLTTTGTTEIAIADAVFNGTNSGWTTLQSDTYQKQLVDKFGTLAIKEDRTNENGVVTLKYPTSQMYLDILFAEEAATITGGSTSGGSVKNLGLVSVDDTEIASVSNSNLIVIGGSCVNKAAAKMLGSDTPLCGAEFTEKSGVGLTSSSLR